MNPQGLIGMAALLLIALALSTDRRRINLRIVVVGVLLQVVIAFLCIRFAPTVAVFNALAHGVNKVIAFADEGTRFIFGNLATVNNDAWGFIFAVKVLPIIIFFASLMSVLYYIGVMQRVVAAVAWMLRSTMGVTGTEALSNAANIFLGQTEAPLCVKPYIARMTRSQIMTIMTAGFASIAGSVLAAYVLALGGDDGVLGGPDDEARVLFARHLMTGSVMSAPAAFVMSKIMLPETEELPSEQLQDLTTKEENEAVNIFDAAAIGATDGLKLALNVAAMLIAFVSLLALLNWPLYALGNIKSVAAWRAENGIPDLTFQNILGMVLAPLAWTLGVEWRDCRLFGGLMGTQVIATEFVAYLNLGSAIKAGEISSRSAQIATYALCGFANFPSIAIQIGGLSAIAPERRSDFASLGLRAMTAGALAVWMTGAVAGLFIG